MNLALIRCRDRGNSLRDIARVARISPGTLSLIRHGRQGLPLSRIPATADALGLSGEEKEVFVLLVRSTQAKRAVQRGTSYVDEIEVQLSRAKKALTDLMTWATGVHQPMPPPLLNAVHQVIGTPSMDGPQPTRPMPTVFARARPSTKKPVFDSADRDRLEAKDDGGRPVPAEYRIRVRDNDGLLMHGDIIVVAGIDAVVEDVKKRYAEAELGEWPSGWYTCEIIRKAIPDAMLCIALQITKVSRNRHTANQ